ncbi:hypothetical protein LJC13_01285 [Peptostreptococcaceae bacterium OttesenSCG-928-C18]|nr:hypothetical protein [Peptostreptococcaceae bacterium OttesenSCG-928-C18]
MAKKFFNFFIVLLGGIFGFTVVYILDQMEILKRFGGGMTTTIIYVSGIILFSLIFYFILPKIIKGIDNSTKIAELEIINRPLGDTVFSLIGMIIGLVIASLVTRPLYEVQLPFVGNIPMVIIAIIIYIALGYLGLRIGRLNRGGP